MGSSLRAAGVDLHAVGNKIGNLRIRKAQQRRAACGASLPDRDLAYLTERTSEFDDYVSDLLWAQEFARLNREEMMDRARMVVGGAIYGTPQRAPELEV